MVKLTNLNAILLVSYLIIVVLIGYFSSKKETLEGYLIADRKVRILPLAASLCAGLVGGGVLITTAALSFEYGLSFIWFYIGAAISFFIFPFFGKRIKRISDKHKFFTLSDYFYYFLGVKNGILSTIIVFLMFFALLVAQFIAGGKILSGFSNFSYTFSIFLIGIIVIFYLSLGGFKAVIKTDYFQYILMFILALILFFILKDKSIPTSSLNILSIGFGNIIAFVLLGGIPLLVQADVWQRAYASLDYKTLKKSFILAGIMLLVFGFAIGIIGLVAQTSYPSINPESALIVGLGNLFPSWFFGFTIILLFASIMSTLDTAAFVTATNISNDILKNFKNSIDLKRITKLSVIIIILFGLVISLFIQNLIEVVFSLVSLSLCMAPALLISFFKKLKKNAIFLSMLTGFLSVILLLFFGMLSEETAVVSLPISLLFLIIGQFIFKS